MVAQVPAEYAGQPPGQLAVDLTSFTIAAGNAVSVTVGSLVTLSVDQRFNQIPDDSAAAVFTSGLLGDQYVSLQPGGSPEMFKNGDEVVLTQSSMQLEELIGKYLVGSGDSGKGNDKPAAKPDQPADLKPEKQPELKPAAAKPAGS